MQRLAFASQAPPPWNTGNCLTCQQRSRKGRKGEAYPWPVVMLAVTSCAVPSLAS